MLIHHLRTTWRSFLTRKLHTLVNVIGLALGFTCFVGAYVFVHYVESADRHFSNADRIHVVFQQSYVELLNFDLGAMPLSSSRLAEQLRIDLPELEAVARLTTTREGLVSTEDNQSFRRVRYAQPSFLDIFELDFLYGSEDVAVGQARSAILTEQAALAMFGTLDARGQTIELPDGESIAIAGVISAIPEPSHLGISIFSEGFEVLIVSAIPEDTDGPEATYFGAQTEWLDPTVYSYVLLPEDGRLNVDSLNEYLGGLGPRFVDEAAGRVEFDARPVSRIAAESVNGWFWGDYPISVTGVILLLGAMVLAIAGANFVNLATAAVTARTREVAVRKVVGASRTQIVLQYLLEAILTAAVALLIALVIVEVTIPAVNAATQKTFSIPWSLEFGWLLIGVVILCGLLVGGYPALLLSRIRPTQALRMTGWGAGSRIFRTILITAQFTAASFLAIVMLVVQNQNSMLREAGLRFAEDPYVVIQDTPDDVGVSADVLRTALFRSPEILDVTGANSLPWEMMIGGTAYSRSPDPAVETVFTQQRAVSSEYFEVLGMEIVAGSSFSAQQQAGLDTASSPYERLGSVILDRVAAERFGWPDPADAVGQILFTPTGVDTEAYLPMEVIGVVERPPFEVLGWGFDAFAYELHPRRATYPIIRIAKDGVGPALTHIDSVWRELVPHSPIRRELMEARFRQMYGMFEMANRVFVALAGLGLLVAAMGLFGIAAFVTGRRRREVGIRKALGATGLQIALLFLRDFCKPVVIANVLAWPFALMASVFYLNTFVQRAELTPQPFVASLALTIFVALIAVASQVVTAATTEPARVLRNE